MRIISYVACIGLIYCVRATLFLVETVLYKVDADLHCEPMTLPFTSQATLLLSAI